MQQLLSDLMSMRAECTDRREALSQKFGLAITEPPVGALGMCFNYATTAAELTSHYAAVWGYPKLDHHTLGGNKVDRAVELTKSLLIFGFSAIEHATKEAAKVHPGILNLPTKGRVYAGMIFGISRDKGLIDQAALDQWNCLIELRNCIVHNNAIADVDLSVTFTNGAVVKMLNGQMTKGKEDVLAQLSRWAVQAYADWCDAFLALR
jgi:hypothetical protein